jgi:hypothetical protein
MHNRPGQSRHSLRPVCDENEPGAQSWHAVPRTSDWNLPVPHATQADRPCCAAMKPNEHGELHAPRNSHASMSAGVETTQAVELRTTRAGQWLRLPRPAGRACTPWLHASRSSG